jgi:hypothetical protein
MKKHLPIIAIIVFSLITLKSVINNRYVWHTSGKIFVIGSVNEKEFRGAGPSSNKYTFKLNGNQYQGIGWGSTLVKQGEYYIVVVAKKDPTINDVQIQFPINPKLLVPQPPDGWTESPINEDGSIKEKYKRHKKEEQTEENQITGVEFSAQDSAQITKESVEFLKQHTLPNQR